MIYANSVSEYNEFVLEQAKKVLKLLRERMFDAVICGGLCRDTILGSYAKDADIIVYNWHANDEAETTLKNSFEKALQEISPFFQRCEAYYGMDNSDFELRQIREVIKAKVEGVDIDVIFIEDCHPNPTGSYARFNEGVRRNTILSVLTDFDCPVNMFYYSEEYNMMLHIEAADRVFPGAMQEFCSRFVCKLNISDDRLLRNYMRLKKFKEMGITLIPHFHIPKLTEEEEVDE